MNAVLLRLKTNWKAGLTVSLVSIPLSISLAVASHSTPLAGIITAIWAGLIASIFGGSNFNIVGPTGALSGVIAAYSIAHGMDGLAMLAILSGVLTLIAFALRLERYLIFIPSSVIHGFTLGVAFIIGLNQLNYALGLKDLPQHERLFSNIVESFGHLSGVSVATFVVFLIFLIGLFLFKWLTPRLPGAIVLAPVGIVLGYLGESGQISLNLETLGNKFGNIAFKFFEMPHFQISMPLLLASLTIALIAILETMLSAKIADGMTGTKFHERKEMLGLGLANIASGLAGGIPATAALARTALNVKSGANNKISATISSVFVALISAFLLVYFNYIPMPVIAAILVYVAIQMVKAEHFVTFFKHERSGFFIALIVAAITFYEDPIIGILFGTMISLIIFVEKLSHGQFDITLSKFDKGIVGTMYGEKIREIAEDADILLYSIKGKLCYINSRAHVTRFEEGLEKYKEIILRLREVDFIDVDGVEGLDEIIELVESRGQEIFLTGVAENVEKLLMELSKNYSRLKKKGLVFAKTQDVLEHLGIEVGKKGGSRKKR